jgi:hypothetical protein
VIYAILPLKPGIWLRDLKVWMGFENRARSDRQLINRLLGHQISSSVQSRIQARQDRGRI